MKNGVGFLGILLPLFLGQILSFLIPVKIPGAIYGMMILFFLLVRGAIEITDVKDGANLLIGNMLLMFIPGGVRLLRVYDRLVAQWLPLVTILIVTTFVTMGVTALVTDYFIERQRRREHE